MSPTYCVKRYVIHDRINGFMARTFINDDGYTTMGRNCIPTVLCTDDVSTGSVVCGETIICIAFTASSYISRDSHAI